MVLYGNMNNDNNDQIDINENKESEIKIDLDADINDTIDLGIPKTKKPIDTTVDTDMPETDVDEEIILEDESENSNNTIKKLKDEIKQLKQEKIDLLTNWQKDKADFINARRRDEETKADVIKFSNQILINDLLPIIDGYEQAKTQSTWTAVDEAWRKGIESIIDKLYASLQKVGVESYGKEGDDFDPNIYEALGQEKTDDTSKDHKVAMIMQKGYKLHDKVIRVALVKVYTLQ
jgi:molecular chaperone GrpE